MDPLASLKAEHSSVLLELYSVDRQLGWLESSNPKKTSRVLVSLLSSSKRLAEDLSSHFEREEKTLFPVLEKRMGEKGDPVRVMKQEHQRLLECLRAFTSEVTRMIEERDAMKTWNLSCALQDLRSGLSDHMSREERVLFWLAELHLSRGDRNKVASELAQMNGAGEPSGSASDLRNEIPNLRSLQSLTDSERTVQSFSVEGDRPPAKGTVLTYSRPGGVQEMSEQEEFFLRKRKD